MGQSVAEHNVEGGTGGRTQMDLSQVLNRGRALREEIGRCRFHLTGVHCIAVSAVVDVSQTELPANDGTKGVGNLTVSRHWCLLSIGRVTVDVVTVAMRGSTQPPAINSRTRTWRFIPPVLPAAAARSTVRLADPA